MKTTTYKLSQVTEPIVRGVKVIENKSDGIEYYDINMQNFYGNEIVKPQLVKNNADSDQVRLKRLKKGDIVIPSRATVTNKIAIFNIDTDIPCIVSHHYWVIRPTTEILDSYFLLYFLLNTRTKDLLNTDKRNQTKSGMITINKETLKGLELELPPIELQNKYKDFFVKSQVIHNFIYETNHFQTEINDNLYQLKDISTVEKDLDKVISLIEKSENIFKNISLSNSKEV